MKEKLAMLWACLLAVPSAVSAQEAAAFDAARFNVAVTYMMPVSYPTRALSYGYSVALRNDSAFVYLPYMGRVYQPVLNDDGLHFSLPADDIEARVTSDSVSRVKFTVRKPPVTYKFTVMAYSNGQADIILIPGNAQSISYSGDWK